MSFKKYDGVRVILNDEMARSMAKGVSDSTEFGLQQMFAQSDKAGDIVVCANKEQTLVLEVVVGEAHDDTAITLYQPHTAFASPGTLMKAREEVIDEIRKRRPEAVMLRDPIRNRAAALSELGFAQLIDTLKAVEKEDGVGLS